MRILVMSDCHGSTNSAYSALCEQPAAENVIFLGDGCSDIEEIMTEFPQKAFYLVSGNCDFYSKQPDCQRLEFAGKKIFAAHGHRFQVKYGEQKLIAYAQENGYDIALYGHTHKAATSYRDGLYVMNPGTLSLNGSHSYGLIDILPSGVLMSIIQL